MGAECVMNKITPSESNTSVYTVNMTSSTSLNVLKQDAESRETNGNCIRGCNIKWALCLDLPLLLLYMTVIGLFELSVIPSWKGGFYCNDPALSHSFNGDTVAAGVIIPTVLLLPVIVVLVTESILFDSTYSRHSRSECSVRRTLTLYRNYFYGFVLNLSVVEVMKGLTGSPRPTFFEICEPDTAKTCKSGEFVSSFECTSTKYSKWMQSDSYHSFPSGHTSLSIYCGFFIAWYLQKRAFHWRNRTVLLVPVLQLLCITYAAICSLTRITDHRHHWWDVLTGAVVGVLCLLFTLLVLCNNFETGSKWRHDTRMAASRQTVHTYDGPIPAV